MIKRSTQRLLSNYQPNQRLIMSTMEEEEAKNKKKIITLKSSDGETFQVDVAVADESQTIRHMIRNDYGDVDECADNEISLPNVTSKILSKVIEYCKKHVEEATKGGGGGNANGGSDEDLKKWDAEFVKVKKATLFDLVLAANYLDIKSLLDLTRQTVADMIKGKTPEEVRMFFNLTPEDEEEEEVRKVFE